LIDYQIWYEHLAIEDHLTLILVPEMLLAQQYCTFFFKLFYLYMVEASVCNVAVQRSSGRKK
jgi:hypothetical protein